jgi:hypothetical protein
MPAAANPALFTRESARLNGIKGAAIRSLRRKQREEAAANARLHEADSVFSLATQQTTVVRAINAKSDAVRGLMAVEAVKQAETLAKAAKNDPGVFKILVDAFDKLFGWSRQDAPACMISVGIRGEIPQPDLHTTTYRSCGVVEAETVSITEHQPEQTGVKP